MKALKRIVIVVGILLAAALAYALLVVNFGTTEAELYCPGEIRNPNDSRVAQPAALFGKVESYRWFDVRAHDHMIFWEIRPEDDPSAPSVWNGFGFYNDSSFSTDITNFEGTTAYGSFSSLSQHIFILRNPARNDLIQRDPGLDSFFEGTCG